MIKKIIKRVGPFTAQTRRDRFLTLVQSIVSQQISGAAAKTILARLNDALAEKGVNPQSLAKFQVDQLRELGISRQKATYILDLSDKVINGKLDLPKIGRLTDNEIVTELTQVKGIGVWTAQMFMMFSLGRMDVFPSGDLGIQQAIKKFYLPDSESIDTKTMIEIAVPWRPYATVASWYLWRSLELK